MDPDRDLDKCNEIVLKLVNEVGEIISTRSANRKSFICKSSDIDLVTETDIEVENHLKTNLLKKFPSHKFIGEEECSSGQKAELTDAPTWIIDPVDGTMNFVHGFPHSCISIALVVDKVIEIGIIYNPMLNQKFTARRGRGAFLNGEKISVSCEKELKKALVVSEFGTSRDAEKIKVVHENFQRISVLAHGVRCLGSAALNMAMVALGAADVNYEMGIHCWDVAAGYIIVREAGGVVVDTSGGDFDMMSRRVLAASSEELAKEVSRNLTQFQPLPRDD
ncbi:inositol monophosphatase 1-like [Condylostylus longicornis]|uniref:inositol monophosphatase 1-like n=1 Tax=Condylostylus longicornis TaxID=2530218 RepID=UPI00244E3F46|nr:inositol monophosphatase 1-like [Condylostylus longicornis]